MNTTKDVIKYQTKFFSTLGRRIFVLSVFKTGNEETLVWYFWPSTDYCFKNSLKTTWTCPKKTRWRTEKMNNKTLAKAIESEIHSYAKENLAIINIFIKEPSLKRFRKTEKMSRISYIASSGGLLGRVCERMSGEQYEIFFYVCRYFPYVLSRYMYCQKICFFIPTIRNFWLETRYISKW